MINYTFILASQILLCWMLVGMIVFVQFVHYPLYNQIKEGFVSYERSHIRRTSYTMGPLMLLELIGAVALITLSTTPHQTKIALIALLCLLVIWLTTFLCTIYQHQKLSVHFSKKLLTAMIRTNWIRSIFWGIRGFLLIYLIYIP